jgi:hypothetical protein
MGNTLNFVLSNPNGAADRIEALEAALLMARARIEYLGVACTDYRHFVANVDIFLPNIDAAISGTGEKKDAENG